MNKQITINTSKLLYKDKKFFLFSKRSISYPVMNEMVNYARQIGDIAFIVDGEMYLDEGALFNLTMKYCNEYIII